MPAESEDHRSGTLTEEQYRACQRILYQGNRINSYWIYGGCSIQTIPKHILDDQYPHMCFKCGKPLKFHELIIANKETAEKQLEKLWKSGAVEFYCCCCYRKETEPSGVRGIRAGFIVFDEAVGVDFGRNREVIITTPRGGDLGMIDESFRELTRQIIDRFELENE